MTNTVNSEHTEFRIFARAQPYSPRQAVAVAQIEHTEFTVFTVLTVES